MATYFPVAAPWERGRTDLDQLATAPRRFVGDLLPNAGDACGVGVTCACRRSAYRSSVRSLRAPIWGTDASRISGGSARRHDLRNERTSTGGVGGHHPAGLVGGRAIWVPSQRVPAQVLVGMRRAGPFAFSPADVSGCRRLSGATPHRTARQLDGDVEVPGVTRVLLQHVEADVAQVRRIGPEPARWSRRAGRAASTARTCVGAGRLLGEQGEHVVERDGRGHEPGLRRAHPASRPTGRRPARRGSPRRTTAAP